MTILDRAEAGTYTILNHVSRCCFARVLRGDTSSSAPREYRCSNCDAKAFGRDSHVLCACGIRLKAGAGPNAGIRCVPNPKPSPECPSRIVAEGGSAK